MSMSFIEQVKELIQANGWENELQIELISDSGQSGVRIRLSENHLTSASQLVNEYWEGISSLEQIQQECLRALRTGRTGI